MYGYNTKYFNKSFLNSFQKSVNESLNQGNKYGIGVNTRLNEDGNYGIGGEGDWDRVSDEQLKNRMRNTKRSNIFTGDEPDEKQNKEYLAARKEYERRQGGTKAQGPQQTPTTPDEPNRTTMPSPQSTPKQTTVPKTAPVAKPSQPGAPLPDWTNDPGSNQKGSGGSNLVELEPGDIRPRGTPTAFAPRPGTPPLVQPQGTMTPQMKDAAAAASQTPASLRQADKRIEAAKNSGVNPNDPSVIPVRKPEVSAIKPGTPTGVPGTKTGPLSMPNQVPGELPGFERGTRGRDLKSNPTPGEQSRIYRPGFESQIPTTQNIARNAMDSYMAAKSAPKAAPKAAAPAKSASSFGVVRDIPGARGVGIDQTKEDLRGALAPIADTGRGLKHFLQRSLGRPET